MKFLLKFCLAVVATYLFSYAALAQLCSKSISGGSATDGDYAYGYAADSLGNQYMCGSFHGNATFGNITLPGTQNGAGFLAKFNPQGGCDWAYRIGSFDDISFFDVEVDRQGNVHTVFALEPDSSFLGIRGTGDGNAVYAVLSPQGILVRSRVFTETVAFHDIAIDERGNVYLGGHYPLPIVTLAGFPAPGQNGNVILKLDAAANPQWVRTQSRQGSQGSQDIIYIAPRTGGGGVAFNVMYYHADMLGNFQLASSTGQGLLAGAIDAQGIFLDHWTMETSDMVVPGRPVFDDNYSMYCGGYHEGSIQVGSRTIHTNGFGDAFVIQLLGAGQFGWARSIGTAADEVGDGLTNVGGRLFLAVDFDSSFTIGSTTITGFHDIALVEFTPSGVFPGAIKFGGPGVESGFGITTNPDGKSVVYGSFQNTITYSSCQLTSRGDEDAFAATLDLATSIKYTAVQPGFALIPNPAGKGVVQLSGLVERTPASLTLIDASGRQVFACTGTQVQVEAGLQVKIPELVPGLYFVNILQNGKASTVKWAVEK